MFNSFQNQLCGVYLHLAWCCSCQTLFVNLFRNLPVLQNYSRKFGVFLVHLHAYLNKIIIWVYWHAQVKKILKYANEVLPLHMKMKYYVYIWHICPIDYFYVATPKYPVLIVKYFGLVIQFTMPIYIWYNIICLQQVLLHMSVHVFFIPKSVFMITLFSSLSEEICIKLSSANKLGLLYKFSFMSLIFTWNNIESNTDPWGTLDIYSLKNNLLSSMAQITLKPVQRDKSLGYISQTGLPFKLFSQMAWW